MQYEEFENKIRVLWDKPIEQLENPEFIKYCEKFYADRHDSHTLYFPNDPGPVFLSTKLDEYIYFKDQINLKLLHEHYMKDERNFDFDIENEIVLFLYDNGGFGNVMLITNKKIYYLLSGLGFLSKMRNGKLPIEHIKGKVEMSGWVRGLLFSSQKIIINGLVLGEIALFDRYHLLPFFQPRGKKLLQKFFDGICSNHSLFFPNAKKQDTFVNQPDEKSVQSKRSFNMRYIIFIFIVIYIGLFFWLSNVVEETVVEILKENNLNVKVDSVSIPYSSPISQSYSAIVRLSNQNKMGVVDFRVSGHFWSGISVSVSGGEIMKINLLAGKSILGE